MGRPARRSARTSPWRGTLLNLALLLLLAALAVGGPRVQDALAAREWAWYHARQAVSGVRVAEEARLAGVEAARALDRAAPLPPAAEGAAAVLALGGELERSDPGSALAAYAPVLECLDRLEASGWRALGLGALAEELRARRQRVQAAVGR